MKHPELTPNVVLCVAAHPDDIDYLAGGSIASWSAAGAQIHYLVLTDGSRGSDDPYTSHTALSATREAEQRSAANTLGVRDVQFGHFTDGELENSQDVKRQIVRAIRELKPDVVLTWDPQFHYSAEHGFINHPDHRAAGAAALDAVYPLARNAHSFTELRDNDGLLPHKVSTVLLLTLTDNHNYTIDITNTFDTKLQAMRAHASQTGNNDENMIRRWAEGFGAKSDVTHAEGFVRIDISI